MNILHITFSDGHGGADIAAARLNKALNEWGNNHRNENGLPTILSSLLVQEKLSDEESVHTFGKFDRKVLQVFRREAERRRVEERDKQFGLFSTFKIGHNISKNHLISEADIIYLHWICGGYQSLKNVRSILDTGKPVYWFCHDMFPITGGCHHSYSCNGYMKGAGSKKAGCKKCQFFINSSSHRKMASEQFTKKKKLVCQHPNLRFVTPSTWLTNCANNSAIVSGHSAYCIKNPIDINKYIPIEGESCKRILRIGKEKKVVAFGAYGALTNVYKGFSYFANALEILKRIYMEDIVVLLFGASYSKEVADCIPYESRFTGILKDDISLITVYNAADVYVIPSLAENLSNTTVESMCCGTPAAGFLTGGLTDLINEKTGVACDYKSSESLAEGIKTILENGKSKYNCREHIIKICAMDIVANEHIEMWKNDGIKSEIYGYKY